MKEKGLVKQKLPYNYNDSYECFYLKKCILKNIKSITYIVIKPSFVLVTPQNVVGTFCNDGLEPPKP